MSDRNQDKPLIQYLRDLERRIVKLEQGAGVKQNDIRLGNIVVSADTVHNNMLNLKDLNTGTVTTIGQTPDIKFSYSGVVRTNPSPPAVVSDNGRISEIVMAHAMSYQTTVDHVLAVNIDQHNFGAVDRSFRTFATLPAGKAVSVTPVNIPVMKNQIIYIQMEVFAVTGFPLTDLSVMVRMGTPYVEETLNTPFP